MSTTAVSLKSILHPTTGKERFTLLLKLCDLHSFWGEQDELSFLQEANETAQISGTSEEKARIQFLLGKYYERKANYEQARTFFDTALGIYTELQNIRGRVDCLVQIATIESARSFFDEALRKADAIIELAGQTYKKGRADALLVRAYARQNLGSLNGSVTDSNAALEIYESLQDIAGIASSYHQIAGAQDGMGNYAEALENLGFALKIREDISDRFGICECLNAIGVIHWKQSNHLEGIKYLFRALKIEEETGDKFAMAVSYNTIGNINSNLGNFEDALKYYGLAQRLCEELGRKKGIASALYNIGIVHYETGNYEVAFSFHLNALQLNVEIGHKESTCASNNYIGKILTALGNYPEALQYQEKALSIGREVGEKRRIGIALTGIGATYFFLGKYPEAEEHLLQALKLGREMGEKTVVKDALFTLVDVCKKKGEFEKALEYFGQYYRVQNEISTESIQKQLTTLNFQHSMEVKEKESALLKEKNEEIERYLHKLEISNNELKQFAHVAAHDLREPLRMISSYMTLLDQSISGNLNEAQKKFISFAIDGSKRMEMLIEDMLRLAKVDADPKLEKIELTSVVSEIRLNLDALLKEKNSVIVMDELPPIMADRTQMLQLFQNIIGNGIKYNESEQPTIEIKHEIKGRELLITIADNGIGIPAHYRERAFQIFQRIPTAKKYAGTGIGLAICKKIVDSMNGKIWVEDNPGGGTRFSILFVNAVAA